MPDHYDALETRDPAARERELFARAARARRARHDGAGLGASSSPASIRSPSPRARRWRSCRCCASPICSTLAEGSPAVRRLQRHAARQGASGCTCRPGRSSSREGHGADFGGAARAMFAAGFRPGDIVHNSLRLSSDARRLHPGGAARTRSAAPSFPAASATPSSSSTPSRIYRPSGYLGTPDFLKILLDTAEKAGKDASSIKRGAGVRRGAAGVAARRTRVARRRGAAMLRHRRDRRDRLREPTRSEGMIVNETIDRGDRAARHRRSGAPTARSARWSSPRSIPTIR